MKTRRATIFARFTLAESSQSVGELLLSTETPKFRATLAFQVLPVFVASVYEEASQAVSASEDFIGHKNDATKLKVFRALPAWPREVSSCSFASGVK